MLTRILIPLDGSALAERALTVSARLAHATGARLILLRIYPCVMGETAPELVAHSETADAREARAYLTQVSQRPDLRGVGIETEALCGTTARAILDAAGVFHADTIVMSSHGRSGLTRWMLGSVAEHVVRYAPAPTLVLRGREHEPLLEEHPEGGGWCASVGLDGSTLAEQALAPAIQLLRALAGQASAEAQLIRIMKPPIPADDELAAVAHETPAEYERRLVAAQEQLRAVAERLRTGDLAHYGVRARWSVVQAGDIATALIQTAEHPEWTQWRTVGADGALVAATPCASVSLVALATHGRGGLQRWALGSVAERVLEGSTLPLLLIRPNAD